MIVLDTETTGLKEVSLVPVGQQPYMIEFAALRLNDDTLEEVGHLTFMCKPPLQSLDPKITKITGIRFTDLQDKKPFAAYYPAVVEFFLGERWLVAHNLPFDRDILRYELARMDRVLQFPWPPGHLCTVELNTDITGKYLSQSALYQHAFGRDPAQTHRALDDVRQLADIVRWMRAGGKL